MAVTDIQICSRALVRLGARPIQSFTDGTDISTACSLVYTSILESEISLYPWRFAMKKAQLSQLANVPVGEWRFAYQLPTDRIGEPFALFNSPRTGIRPKKNFAIYSDKIFCNYLAVYIDYPFKPIESAFPAYFTEFMVLALASQLAKVVTDQASIADEYRALAYGTPSEAGSGGALMRARAANAMQEPPQAIQDFTLIDARF